jgi:hypothetical protein
MLFGIARKRRNTKRPFSGRMASNVLDTAYMHTDEDHQLSRKTDEMVMADIRLGTRSTSRF